VNAVRVALLDHRVRDVLVPGWIDRDDDVPVFRPQPLVVWLRLDDGLLRFETPQYDDRLRCAMMPAVTWDDIDVLAASEDEVIIASYGEQLFGDGRDGLRCTEIRKHRVDKALALDFEGGHTLFLDPSWPFGFRIGDRAQEQRWVQDYGNGQVETTTCPAS